MGLAFVVGGYEASGKDRSYGGMTFLGSLLLAGAAVPSVPDSYEPNRKP